jgi:type IX secretion system PorP/SprF family membrane protein
MNLYKFSAFATLFFYMSVYSQGSIPIYSDYLTDNYYIIHPSMAGAANCAKLRLTARGQWFGQSDAPQLQTLSYNGKMGDKSGVGAVAFNDINGYNSQKGLKLTYAYHLMFSRDELDINQLSFGISAGVNQTILDETTFLTGGVVDPSITGSIVQDTHFNFDFGMSYFFLNTYAHFTIKNAAETERSNTSVLEDGIFRKYLVSIGHVFGDKNNILIEPSILYQNTPKTNESVVDLNVKAYKTTDYGSLWAGISYRKNLDAKYVSGTSSQNLSYFTPLLGVNYKNAMLAYNYTYLNGNVNFSNSGFHQITLGLNLFCKRDKYECNCPALN